MPNAAVEQGLRPHPVVRACSSACRLCLSRFAPRSYIANCTVAQPVFRHSSPFVAPQPRNTPQQPHASIRCKSGPGGPIPGCDARGVLDLVNDSVKWVVTLLAAFVLLRHRSVYVNWCLVGSIVAALSCKVLKRLINKQRPVYARKTDPGMPSSHATSLSYLTTYLMITFSRPLHTLLTLGLALFLVSLRVVLGYHSVAQVCVGAFLGGGMACAWHQLGQRCAFQIINTSHYGSTILMAITWTAGLLFLVKIIAKAAKHNSIPAAS